MQKGPKELKEPLAESGAKDEMPDAPSDESPIRGHITLLIDGAERWLNTNLPDIVKLHLIAKEHPDTLEVSERLAGLKDSVDFHRSLVKQGRRLLAGPGPTEKEASDFLAWATSHAA